MKLKHILVVLVVAIATVAGRGVANVRAATRDGGGKIGFWPLYYKSFEHARYVDLTHTFGRNTPHWHGFGPMKEKSLFTIRKNGFHIDMYCHVGQWGTHVDAPAHFHRGLRTVDQIPSSELLLPLVVLDVHRQVAKDPDYRITLADVHAWERRYGPIPPHSFVAMRTGWSQRWHLGEKAMENPGPNGVEHFPGWSLPVLQYLNRLHVTAIGHETTDTDGGIDASKNDYALESYWLGTNHYQIEMLAHLHEVPDAGALVMVTFPKPHHGTGFPARVVAIVPAGAGARAR